MNAETSILSPLGEAAIGYTKRGWPVFPIKPGCKGAKDESGKSTHLLDHGHLEASTDADQVRRWWTRWPDANIGLHLAAAGLLAVDADTYKQTCGWRAFIEGRDIPATLVQRSASGGAHYIFKAPAGAEFPGILCADVEIKHKGYILLEPSVFGGGTYRFETDDDPAVCPDWVPGKATRKIFKIATGDDLPEAGPDEVREALTWIDADIGYADWLAVLMALHDAFGDAGLDLAGEWSARGAKHVEGEVEAKWRGFTAGGGASLATVFHHARAAGCDLGALARKHRFGDKSSGPRGSAGGGGDSSTDENPGASDAEEQPAAGQDDPVQLIHNRRGHLVWCSENACQILETNQAWHGVLAYDEFNARTMLLRPIPGSKTPRASFRPRALADRDITETLRWFNRNSFPDATRNTVADAVFAVAQQTIISPVRHFLEALAWDGRPRIGNWLETYCGAADTPFTRAVGRAWLISAVARALAPGCKADHAIILEGRQGTLKSSALRTLAGEAWFFDGLRDFGHKDASAALRGKWIIELPELAAMRRSDVETIKAYLSRNEERYRPAYGRAEVFEPRRCVFAGTTNRTDYMADDTGNRRFWPVAVARIDLAALARDRDQLWAEAAQAYRRGFPWWLNEAGEAKAAEVTSLRTEDDPWTAVVLSAAAGLAEASTHDLLQIVGIDRARMTKADAMRVGGILVRHGWQRDGKFTGGHNRDHARYVPRKAAP